MTMQKIPLHEINFHAHSFFDPVGRLFWWNGKLYRGISSEWMPFFKQLFHDGLIQKLVEQGLLIETELAPLYMDGCGMVVSHRVLPFLSYPYEWCPIMFKNAALTILDLIIELSHYNLTLKDGHPWNILFDSYKPIYIDFPSIAPIENDSIGHKRFYEDFIKTCLYPLLLMSCDRDVLARLLLASGEEINQKTLLKLTSNTMPSMTMATMINLLASTLEQNLFSQYFNRAKKILSIKLPIQKQFNNSISQINSLKAIRQELENISLSVPKTGRSKCRDNPKLSLLNQDNWTTKQKNIYRILSDLHPHTLLDIGSNVGWYSKLAALLGSQVIAFDKDPMYVSQLYDDAQAQNLSILPLTMDFIKPTPSCGPSSHWSIAATERFQCDMVLALGILHHLVRDLYFEQIIEGLASFSKHWLMVEFIPREDQDMRSQWWSSRISWYTLDNFVSALRQKFRHVTLMPSHPEHRSLLLCEK